LWSVGQPDERATYGRTGSTAFLRASTASVSVEVGVASDLFLSIGTAAPEYLLGMVVWRGEPDRLIR